MKEARIRPTLLFFVLLPCLPLRAQGPPSVDQVLNKYCITCHNQRTRSGGLALDAMALAEIPAHSEIWEKVVQKLRSGTMPPAGMPRPDLATYRATASWLEERLDAAEPFAGRPAIHRLNRAEYANSIRDLLNLEVDVNALLPPDDSAFGFDNNSDALGVSPALQERQLAAAVKIAALAVGDPSQPATSQTWRIRQDLSQNQHVEGLPLGTVGGTGVHYNFPLDGQYRLQAKLYRTNLNIMRGLQTSHQVEFSVDGKRVYLATIGGPTDLAALFDKPTETGDAVDARLQVEVPITAGPHTVSVAFVQNTQFAEPVRLQSFVRSSVDNFDWAGHPHLQNLTVSGPFHPNGSGDTPSRKRIFVCRPENASKEAACARTIVTTLLKHANRQGPSAADIHRAMEFYAAGRRGGPCGGGADGDPAGRAARRRDGLHDAQPLFTRGRASRGDLGSRFPAAPVDARLCAVAHRDALRARPSDVALGSADALPRRAGYRDGDPLPGDRPGGSRGLLTGQESGLPPLQPRPPLTGRQEPSSPDRSLLPGCRTPPPGW